MISVGVISGKEAFTSAILDELNSRPGVSAEWLSLGPQSLHDPGRYDVIIDRLSHCYEFYQAYLKRAALTGTYVINNPFRFLCDDKFFNYGLAQRLGVPVPKTILLPSREYDDRMLEPEDLHNLHPEFVTPPERFNDAQLALSQALEMVGVPAILKPYDGYGWREVYRIDSLEELTSVYNESMMDVMMLQEFIEFEHYVRCFVIGAEAVLATRYNPATREYIVDHNHLSAALGEQIVTACRSLCRALSYDVNTVEFAIRDGVPYAIDFMNPVPEAKPEVITPIYFSWLVDNLCDFVETVGRERRATPYTFHPPELALG